MPDARYVRDGGDYVLRTANATDAGEIWQLASGLAAYQDERAVKSSGTDTAFTTSGNVTVTKSTGVVILDGGRVYWDHSANAATYKKVNDRDFYIGRAVGDAASADSTLVVSLNVPEFGLDTIDLLRDAALSVPTGTQAVGAFGYPKPFGGSLSLELTATNEAQCIDLFSVDRVAISANAIAEFIVRIGANGSTNAVDLNFGVANGTSTTDADAIAESCFIHIDGGSTTLNAESDDGTTEVAATDTTKTFTAGTAVSNRKEFWFDLRNPADIQIYVDGELVLSATTFTLNAGTGPIGLLAHLEKTSSTATAGPVYIDRAALRIMEQ